MPQPGNIERFAQVVVVVLLASCWTAGAQAERRGEQRGGGEEWAAAAGQTFGPWFGESEAERQALEDVEIDPREERRIGDAALDGFLNSLKHQRVRVLTRGKDVEYLEALVSQIRPLMRHAERYQKIRVYWADSKETDARAFPGGSIVVMRGLLEFAQSEAALVGVLAHELSHIDHGHQLRQARAMKLAQDRWSDPEKMSYGPPPNIMLMTKQFARPFRAEDEAAADHDAAQWMHELGYDPQELANVFRRMGQRQPTRVAQMPSFLRTHPYHVERYAAIKAFAEETRKRRPEATLYVGAENLRRRVPRSVREFAE